MQRAETVDQLLSRAERCEACAARDAWVAGTVRTVLLLSWVSLLWMGVEGALGLHSGLRAHSLALTACALGSAVEGLASAIVIWRFTGSRRRPS